MNAQTKIEAVATAEIIPFNSYAAYQREREHARKLESLLARAAMLLSSECGRREREGEDVAHLRAFIREASL